MPNLDLIEAARIDFLFGVDGAPPTRSLEALHGKYNLRMVELQRHSEVWYMELEAHAKSMSQLYDRTFTPAVLDAHEDDALFLRNQMNKLKGLLSNTEPHMVGMDTYQFRMSQFIAMSKRWTALTGIDTAQAVVKNAHSSVMKHFLSEVAERAGRGGTKDERKVDGSVFDVDGEVE